MLEKNIEITTKSASNFAKTFIDYHLLPDINFNGHLMIILLRNNNISISKKVTNIFLTH